MSTYIETLARGEFYRSAVYRPISEFGMSLLCLYLQQRQCGKWLAVACKIPYALDVVVRGIACSVI